MLSRMWIIFAIFIHQIIAQSTPSFQSFDKDPQSFCSKVPSLEDINEQDNCGQEGPELFKKPLRMMRECCDKSSDAAIKTCLGRLKDKEEYIVELFLHWKEPEEKDAEYMTNLRECQETYENINVESRGCADKYDIKCVDPIGFYEKNVTKPSSLNHEEKTEAFLRTMRQGAVASFCVNNASTNSEMSSWESVHHRCFRQGALNLKYKSVMDDVKTMEKFCLNEMYGEATSWEVYQDLQTYKNYSLFLDMIKEWAHGFYEEIETRAEAFLPELCGEENYNHTITCLQTPVTQTYLTFKSSEEVKEEVDTCCSKSKPFTAEDKAKVQEVRECLTEKKLFRQFYQLGGLFLRGVKRQATGYSSECTPNKADEDRNYQFVDSSILINEYGHDLPAYQFEEKFNEDTAMNQINYHFFLRDLARDASVSDDEYYKAACEACSEGEELGQQAYVYPGFMCPALVTKKYYEPIFNQKTCPKIDFYKFQVAHYCCLDAAVEKFNFGPAYDPTNCHNM